jgi:methylmalonyl-CoA mutase N-terminal domain/subunit
MKERFEASNPNSQMCRFHTQTAGSSLTAQQPLNNVVRTTLEAFAAVCGGTQSLHTNGFDEALGLPTEESATLALRTQQIIAYESGIAATIDPFAGSYVVEALTDDIEQKVFARIKEIDDMGGMVAAIESGFPQREIERSAFEYQRSLERGEVVVVGVNRFVAEEESSTPIQKIDSATERSQCERISLVRGRRNSNLVSEKLAQISAAAREHGPIFEQIVEALRYDATLGEIADALRAEFGEF